MGEPSFGQLAMEIAAPLLQDGLITGFDFIIDHGDDEYKPVEVPSNNDSSEDGEAVPTIQSQQWSSQS